MTSGKSAGKVVDYVGRDSKGKLWPTLWLIPNQGPLVYNRVTGLACHAHRDNFVGDVAFMTCIRSNKRVEGKE